MTAIQWANRVRCDWPGCTNEAEVTLKKDWPEQVYPQGWTSISPNMNVVAANGWRLNDYCPTHSTSSLAAFVAAYPRKTP